MQTKDYKQLILMGDIKIYFNWAKNLIRRMYYNIDFDKADWDMLKKGLTESYQIPELKQVINSQVKALILKLLDANFSLEELSKEALKTLFDNITVINQLLLKLYNFQDLTNNNQNE